MGRASRAKAVQRISGHRVRKLSLPPDWEQKAEWVRARLRYPDIYGYPDHPRVVNRDGSPFPGYWTMDYPRSDRHLLAGIRRLTRIDTRSVEQVVTLDGTDDIFNWPVLYGVEVGHWQLRDAEAKQLRDYLLRGGFFMCDDFHGNVPYRPVQEWDTFIASMSKVFPDRQDRGHSRQRSDFSHAVRSAGSVSGARRAIFRDRHHV